MAEDRPIVNFISEAKQVLQEVSYAVQEGLLSPELPSSPECTYFNLTTREGDKLTVRLSMKGFEVVGNGYDNRELEPEPGDTVQCFETVYALLNHVSPSYQQIFNHAVSSKLQGLCASNAETKD